EEKQGPSKKQIEAEKKAQLAEIFKPVLQQQKIPFGTDPKTILCAYFKVGQCTKGDKCKFSHDLNIERKSAKIDLYTDKRALKEEESMDSWDQSQLESVILSKHGNPRTQTDIVCKYFLEAIETKKYGWFWTCPNGGDQCKYNHALPPGYVLKKAKDEPSDDDLPTVSLEEFLETERLNLGSDLTPVTLETFTAWKKKKQVALAHQEEKSHQAKVQAVKSGKKQGLTGRDLFTFHPDLITEEDLEGLDGNQEKLDLSGYLPRNLPVDSEIILDASSIFQDPSVPSEMYLTENEVTEIDESLFLAENLENLNLEYVEEENP
ncbi:hypothetical protein HMI54_000409, partial [Coelomomyces lativittatus]